MQKVTVLRTLGPLLAKRWLADGTIAAYDNAKQFTFAQHPVVNLSGLHQLLRKIQLEPECCIIRGAPNKEIRSPTPRDLDHFHDAPSHLMMLDVDNWAGTVEEFVAGLPECFHDVSYVRQWSGSHGHPSKVGVRAHLWFWLKSPLTCQDAEAWAKKWIPQADATVHRVVQVNYTAVPVHVGRRDAPLPPGCPSVAERLLLVRGVMGDEVEIPDSMPTPAGGVRATGHAKRKTLVDPRNKSGVVGAVARAFSPERIVDLFPDQFAEGSKPERLTWLGGGGAADGVRVTDSSTHLFNSHSTAPVSHAAPLFDFVRHHIYGHLDDDIDEDARDLDVAALPSYKATVAWALAQPEVQAELDERTPAGRERAVDRKEAHADAKAEKALAATEPPEDDPDAVPDKARLMTNLLALIAKCPDREKLQHDLGRRIAKAKSLDEADRAVIAQHIWEKSKELTGTGKPLPKPVIAKWLKPAAADVSVAFPDLGPDGEVLGTIQNLEALCAQNSVTLRYNEITKDQEIQGLPESDLDPENRANATFAGLISLAARARMPHNPGQIKGYVTSIAGRNTYNPVQEWITSAEWDGASRLDALLATLTLAPESKVAVARMMLRKWLIQAVAAACSRRPIQTRGVLVFQGPQYMGKSRWFERLCKGHDEFVIMGRPLDPHNKDSITACITHWIAELGELDNTLSKNHIGALKAFIADREDTLRLPYAAANSKFQRRTVWTASVNNEEYLVDNTGNTRFWSLSLTAVNPDHDVDMQQLWAEMYTAWEGGEAHWLEQDEMAQVEAVNEKHRVVSPVEQALIDRFPWDRAAAGDSAVTWVKRSSQQIAALIGVKLTASDSLSMGHAITRISGMKPVQKWGLGKLRLVPMLRQELELDELDDDDTGKQTVG
jgi:putative DNA primase/helicase